VKRIWDAVSGHECGKIGKSPKQAWSGNLERITGNGLLEASFYLKNLNFLPRGGSVDDPDQHSMGITPADRNAMTPTIAIPHWKRNSTAS